MTEKHERTEAELLAAILRETEGAHDRLHAIAGWIVFFGILVIIGLLLGACSAVLGVGGLMGVM